MAADLRDTVKWVATSILTVGSALCGAAVLTRLGNATGQSLTIAVGLALTALIALIAVAMTTAWAMSVPEPKLSDLVPELAGADQSSEATRAGRERLDAEISKAAPISQYKYNNLQVLGVELLRRRSEWERALQQAGPGAIGAAWSKSLPESATALEGAYDELREVADGLRLVRTQRRAAFALPAIVAAGAVVVLAVVPFVIVAKPPEVEATAGAAIGAPVQVRVTFPTKQAVPVSDRGCTPPRITSALAVGGTWLLPTLLFREEPRRNRLGVSPDTDCPPGTYWYWTADDAGQVVLRPE